MIWMVLGIVLYSALQIMSGAEAGKVIVQTIAITIGACLLWQVLP